MIAGLPIGRLPADLKGPDTQMSTLKCISPIDGSVFAERPVVSMAQAEAMVERARKAQ